MTDKIGYLKLQNKRIGLNITLKKIDKKGNIELPAYEKFLNQHCQIKSHKDMIEYLLQWSDSNGKRVNKSLEAVISAYQEEVRTKQDSWLLSNGHDFAYMLAYFIHKKVGCKKKSQQDIESYLVLAYEHEFFKHTNMFRSMYGWIMANNNNETLFSFDV